MKVIDWVAVGTEVLEAKQEAENEKRLADSRRKINNEFLSIARDTEKEKEQNLRNIVYSAVTDHKFRSIRSRIPE